MKPKVCHVIKHSCIRVHKLAAAQNHDGEIKPYLYNQIFSHAHPHWQYEVCFRMFAQDDKLILSELERNIRTIDPWIDLWHVHNTPDLFAEIIRSISKKPLFWDVHDIRSIQLNESFRGNEDKSAASADHLFTVSKEYEAILKKRYPDKNCTVYHSRVPLAWYPNPSPTQYRRMAYQGGLSFDPNHYRCVWDYFGRARVPIDVYPAASFKSGEYLLPENCALMKTHELFPLFRKLTKYEAGFVGTAKPHAAFEGALPNKLFEYIACGIPVIAAHVPAVADFLEEHPGIGIVCNDPREVPEALEKIQRDRYRQKVAKMRHRFAMDAEAEKVKETYRKYW